MKYVEPPVWEQLPDINDFEKPGMFDSYGEALLFIVCLAAIVGGFVWAVGVL